MDVIKRIKSYYTLDRLEELKSNSFFMGVVLIVYGIIFYFFPLDCVYMNLIGLGIMFIMVSIGYSLYIARRRNNKKEKSKELMMSVIRVIIDEIAEDEKIEVKVVKKYDSERIS